MAYSEVLADRIRGYLDRKASIIEAKRMMGALVFMVNDKMCAGVMGDSMLVRLDPTVFEAKLLLPNVVSMAGDKMKGFVLVAEAGLDKEADLRQWLDEALEFNKVAKASKRRRKK